MAETPDRQLAAPGADDVTPPSTAHVIAAIRETRLRLATRLTRTADHVHQLFTAPSTADAEPSGAGVIDGAVKAIALVGRTKRAWDDARRSGVFRRAAIGATAVAIAAVLVVVKRRHR